MEEEDILHYLADDPPTIVPLAIKPHFNALNPQQKLYAHYVSIACYAGTRIVLRQVSPESEPIFDLIIELYRHCNGDWKALQEQALVPDDEMQHFLNYAAQFLGNLGNFKSFGDTKFIPRTAVRHFKALACATPKALMLYEEAWYGLYANDTTTSMQLGYPDGGHISPYYPHQLKSPCITKEEVTIISDLFESKKLLPENTRIRKKPDCNFELLIASANADPTSDSRDVQGTTFELDGPLAGKTVSIVYGDHTTEMQKVSQALQEARKYALNETETAMLDQYIKSFESGSQEAYVESQKLWVQDKGPMVESVIGFIETYRDPHGIRGEWEGFTAMVNQERTKAFSKLVEAAPTLIGDLPWSKEFEKDKFLSPDFTSLEVLTFCGSGIPAGINIPNFDSVRQMHGFKNVSLGNVLSASSPHEPPVPFVLPAEVPIYVKHRDAAFEVQVGLHELLGHGCGKLLQETSPGIFNFDTSRPPTSPLTKAPIQSYYKPGQTYSSVFGPLAAAYEECRAECVAMALICEPSVLRIFGLPTSADDQDTTTPTGTTCRSPSSKRDSDSSDRSPKRRRSSDQAHKKLASASLSPAPPQSIPVSDTTYVSYLSMARAGLAALEYYDPPTRKWGQAHMQARFSILQTFLRAGAGFCSVQSSDASKPDDICVRIDRAKIHSHGRPAVEEYLTRLQVFKATADVDRGRELFEGLTSVDEWWGGVVREAVLARKMPRKVFVQASTVLGEDGGVELREYESTAEGMVRSWAEREYV